jgi:hypothetical protein
MSTYYLISSLPMLSIDSQPLITAEAFLVACQAQLSADDADAAEALLRNTPSQHPFVLAWRDKDTILRNAIARARARLADIDAERWIRSTEGCDTGIDLLVDDAFEQPDPLKREKEIDDARWLIAESLQGYDPMGVNVALGYAIKLTIALRWTNLNADLGRETFEQLTRNKF